MGLHVCPRSFFSLPRVGAGEIGASSLEGRPVGARDWSRPRFAVLLMGWSRALAYRQRVHDGDFERACRARR
eukprot:8842036-Pyramimonas_sp.AAC.1